MARKLTLRHYGLLASTHIDTTINPDEDGRFLLYRRAALEYEAERWIGVHPLLWETSEFKVSLDAARKARGSLLRA
jgi:RecB family exonuclease